MFDLELLLNCCNDSSLLLLILDIPASHRSTLFAVVEDDVVGHDHVTKCEVDRLEIIGSIKVSILLLLKEAMDLGPDDAIHLA